MDPLQHGGAGPVPVEGRDIQPQLGGIPRLPPRALVGQAWCVLSCGRGYNKTLKRVQMGWTKVFEDLAGQVAVITGGARGLGLSMAQALARWGTKIALLDVLAEVKDSAAIVQHEFAVESVGVAADVTDDSSVTAAFGEVSRTLGSPSI